jgi:hypothetical protein
MDKIAFHGIVFGFFPAIIASRLVDRVFRDVSADSWREAKVAHQKAALGSLLLPFDQHRLSLKKTPGARRRLEEKVILD